MKATTTNRREFLLRTLAIPTAAIIAVPLLTQDASAQDKGKDKDKSKAPEAPKGDTKDKDAKGDAKAGDAKAKGKGGKGKGAKGKGDAKDTKDDTKK